MKEPVNSTHGDMTDWELTLISPALRAQPRGGPKRSTDLSAVVDGIMYQLQNGCAWSKLPKGLPTKGTVYWCFRRYVKYGTGSRRRDARCIDCRDLEDRRAADDRGDHRADPRPDQPKPASRKENSRISPNPRRRYSDRNGQAHVTSLGLPLLFLNRF